MHIGVPPLDETGRGPSPFDRSVPRVTRLDTRLDPVAYLAAIRRESARFLVVLGDCDPAARVPACPDWDAADLVWHLAEVQWFWSEAMAKRPDGPPGEGTRPERAPTYDGLLEQYAALSAGLIGVLDGLDPDEPAWSWADHVPDGRTAGFTFRRQAHEALIHRLDAEQTAGPGHVTPPDPRLAADGVAELLEVMYGGAPPSWAAFTPGPHHVRVDLTDTGTSLWVRPGTLSGTDPDSGRTLDGPHLLVVDDPGSEPDAVVSGTAGGVDAAWWGRVDDGVLDRVGDPDALQALRLALSSPLD